MARQKSKTELPADSEHVASLKAKLAAYEDREKKARAEIARLTTRMEDAISKQRQLKAAIETEA